MSAPTASYADASFVVDASPAAEVKQCDSCDDLNTLQNIFQGATIPWEPAWEPQLSGVGPIIAALNMKRFRFLQSDMCDISNDYKFSSTGPVADDPAWLALGFSYFLFSPPDGSGSCNYIDWTLGAWTQRYNLAVHFPVASFLPPSFEIYGPAETWSTQTDSNGLPVLDRYKQYADRLVRYAVTKAFENGASSVVFEVSNELDGADVWSLNYFNSDGTPNLSAPALLAPLRFWGRWLWWIDPTAGATPYAGPNGSNANYPLGTNQDPRRVQHGIAPMEQIYSKAIDKIRREIATDDDCPLAKYRGRSIEIAGPAFTSSSFAYYPSPSLEELFLDQMLDPNTLGGQLNAKLDRFSFHFYGDFKKGNQYSWPWFNPATASYTTLQHITSTIRTKLSSLGYPDLPLFVSEWGPSIDEAHDVNYSHKGAAWAAGFLKEAVDDGVTMGSYLVVEDAGNLGTASLLAKNTDTAGIVHFYPKPAANVFQMFAMMSGKRAAVTPPPAGSEDAFAASDTSSAHIVVFKYDSDLIYMNNGNTLVDTPENFTVQFNNLQFNGTVAVQRYVVDATNSNLAAFYANSGTDPGLQQVEQFTATVQNGQLFLAPRQLGLGVSYWQVQACGPGSAIPACPMSSLTATSVP